jgi:hypothetical protein
MAEAQADRVFERGWIPNVLPPTAGPISEAHNLDTNTRCARARFPSASRGTIVSALLAAGFSQYRDRTPAPSLRECPFTAEESRRNTVVFRHRNPDSDDFEFAAVSPNGDFFYWSGAID